MNTLSRVAVSFAAMVGLGPIFALAQVPPARPSRPPPSSPGSARARAPSWNALETEPELRPERPGAAVRVPPPPPEPDPWAPWRAPRFADPATGAPYAGPTLGPPSTARQPECFPAPGAAPFGSVAPSFGPALPNPAPAFGAPAAPPTFGAPSAPPLYGRPSFGPTSPAPPYGPASVVPHSQPPGAAGAGVPPGTPWTPAAVGAWQSRAAGPPVPAPRTPPTFDAAGCPSCGGGMQHRSDALSVGPDGTVYNEGPVRPNPGGLPLAGSLEHSWQACVSCGTTRGAAVSALGEVDPRPGAARRADAVGSMRSNCPSGQCSRIVVGESQVGSHTGQTYYGTATACAAPGCGASALTVHEGTAGAAVTTRGGQVVVRPPARANGTPGFPLPQTGHMADPEAAQGAAHGATRALQDAWRQGPR